MTKTARLNNSNKLIYQAISIEGAKRTGFSNSEPKPYAEAPNGPKQQAKVIKRAKDHTKATKEQKQQKTATKGQKSRVSTDGEKTLGHKLQ